MQQEAETGTANHASSGERDLVEISTRLVGNLGELLLAELALARAELGEGMGRLALAAFLLLAGLLTAFAGGLALIAALVLLLGDIAPLWCGAALVGCAVIVAGVILILRARRMVAQTDFVPRHVLRSAREACDWAREEVV